MKLKLASAAVLVVLSAMSGGCSPGTAHPGAKPNTPDVFASMDNELAHTMGPDALAVMDEELAHTIVGTTTVTSATMELPATRMPVSSRHDDPPPALQTWGTGDERSERGIAADPTMPPLPTSAPDPASIYAP